MDKNQMNETFQGIVDDKYNTVVGKIVEKDGKYMFEGVAMDKRGRAIASVTYVTGLITLTYITAKIGYTIGEKIANKIQERRLRKAKAEAFDNMINTLEKIVENHDESKSEGKHSKDEESE